MQKGFAPILILVGILALGVVVGGVYYLGKSQAPKPQVQNPVIVSQSPQPTISQAPSPTVVSQPASNSDETANWKIYTNKDYHFGFKYPANYSLTETKQFDYNPGSLKLLSAQIKSPNPKPGGGYPQPNLEIIVYKNDTADLNSWVSKYTTTLPFDDPSVSRPDSIFIYRGVTEKKDTIFDGKQAVNFQSRSFESSPNPTLTLSGSYVIGVILNNENETKDPDLRNLYPQILATFKFTP